MRTAEYHERFDRDEGVHGSAGRSFGVVVECHQLRVINRDGNIGPVTGSYNGAKLKILVFGDSWTAFQQHGATRPNFLQETLERRLGQRVHVVNFGRDGYGILQMFDLAAAKVPEWKPDLVIIAFITDDLARARIWRTVVGEGDDVRVVTTVDPDRNPKPERAADTFLLRPSATYEWCRAMAGTGRAAPVLSRLIAKRERLLSARLANVLTPGHSYLYNRIAYGDAFRFLPRNPRVGFTSFATDRRVVRAAEQLRATGIDPVSPRLLSRNQGREGGDPGCPGGCAPDEPRGGDRPAGRVLVRDHMVRHEPPSGIP